MKKLIIVYSVLRKQMLNRNKKYVLCLKVKCFLNLRAETDTPVFVLFVFQESFTPLFLNAFNSGFNRH